MASRLRLVIYVPNAWWGGMQCWATYLLKHLPRDEFEVHIAAWRGTAEALEDLGQYGRLIHLGGKVAQVGPATAELIDRVRPDVVHANTLRVAREALKARVPCVTTLHSVDGDERSGCAYADQTYRVSPAVKGDCPVILTGVDPLKPGERIEQLVVFIGRLDLDRRPEWLLDAMQEVMREVPSARLRVIGKPAERHSFDVRHEVKKRGLNDVTEITGLLPPSEARRLLAEGDVVCAPQYEAFGLGTAEGMSAGLIPVVSDGGYGPEMVGDLGITTGHDGLAKALIRALTDGELRSRRVEIAERARTLYSAERFSNEYAEAYRGLLSRKQKKGQGMTTQHQEADLTGRKAWWFHWDDSTEGERHRSVGERITRGFLSPARRIKQWAEHDWLPGKPGWSVLDVACGNGNYYPLFAQVMGMDYEGCDLSAEMLRIARETYPGVAFHAADATKLPFDDDSYDMVFCTDLLLHLPPELELPVVEELRRVARRVAVVHTRSVLEPPRIDERGEPTFINRHETVVYYRSLMRGIDPNVAEHRRNDRELAAGRQGADVFFAFRLGKGEG